MTLARNVRRFLLFSFAAYLLTCIPLTAMSQTEKPKPEQFSAVYEQSGKATQINIYISNYTSDSQANELQALLKSKGEGALFDAIQKLQTKGHVTVAGSTGWPVPFIRQYSTPNGGRRIVLFGDRPFSFRELVGKRVSGYYQFGLMILELNARGEGEGLLYGACQVTFNQEGEPQADNYSFAPSSVVKVKLER